ncbi:hypothetical protein CDD80_2505 [Ophiocordyceps camponoti-rufipedis]|uniref:3-phytase n=1 Tax=Ophiocordyceps camponoti-rufipedis TaxID=2004952 RepID=A0A2C5XK73_9HYPO|nr:hypothetical protein CDD80_2505 [Ophiocordyceps camponoti-rufipedis]
MGQSDNVIKQGSVDYQPVHQDEDSHTDHPTSLRSSDAELRHLRLAVYLLAPCLAVLAAFNIFQFWPSVESDGCSHKRSKVPQYFQTSPELWAGPTATGKPPFLAETRSWGPTQTYVPNEPLETTVPVEGMAPGDENIFRLMGHLSPYAPAPGFGVEEYPLPEGAEIIQVQMLSRHGSRYPGTDSEVEQLAQRLGNASAEFNTEGPLAFLKNWKYQLGLEMLVSNGRKELFNSGILHSYMYGAMYNIGSKIIARTTANRMLKSAENWLSGFFGLEWTKNATIEVIIDDTGFNNSLSGANNCPNALPQTVGKAAAAVWMDKYLQNAVARFQNMTEGFNWTIQDVYAAQSMCPYETVALGSSKFCDLFTYEEWKGYNYAVNLYFAGSAAFNSPTGRAMGLGYQQEMVARLQNHTLGYSGSQINVTLDNNTETFPLNQTLYFDFSHDTTIVAALTAMGLVQFNETLPETGPPPEKGWFVVSNMVPFGARFDLEVIRTPRPVSAARDGYVEGGETRYVHLVLNQRTVPLGKSFPECDAQRKDGWCELGVFLKVQESMPARAKFDYACFGHYPPVSYGEVKDGAPP